MVAQETWPNHASRNDRTATEVILRQQGLEKDVAYGHTKVRVRHITFFQMRSCINFDSNTYL